MKLSHLDGAPGVIRTPDLLVRSQTLYPTELRAQFGRNDSSTVPNRAAFAQPRHPIASGDLPPTAA
jgi:hypothetical protein